VDDHEIDPDLDTEDDEWDRIESVRAKWSMDGAASLGRRE
jgi:hypothetical protein